MKLKPWLVLTSAIIAFVVPAPDLSGCTVFLHARKGGPFILGENFDFPTGLGQIQVNLKGISKRAFISVPEKALRWTSKFGSVTFNQNGREFPYSGMNEAGLVIVKLMLDETVYPGPDERFGLEELQWIQYHLDVSASVEDIVRSDADVRVSYKSIAPLHFFAADARGHAAVVEYLDGRTVCHTGEDLRHRVLTNSIYRDSIGYLESLNAEARNKLLAEEGRTRSVDRFAKAALLIMDPARETDGDPMAAAFDVLGQVAQNSTHWSIVYDLKRRALRLKTAKNRETRELRLSEFNFSAGAKKLWIDIDRSFQGPSDFTEFDPAANAKLIDSVWDSMEGFLSELPFRKEWARYPNEVDSREIRRFKASAAKTIIELLKSSNFDSARTEIEKIRASSDEYYFGESEMALHAVNMAQNDGRRLPDAIAMLQLSAEIFPRSAMVHYWLGKGFGFSGKQDLAVENFRRALDLDPEYKPAKWDLEGLEAIRNPTVLDEAALTAYAGEYGERRFSMEEGRLVYERQGQTKIILIPMTLDRFMCRGYDNLRFRFLRENGEVTAVEAYYNDGRVLLSKRTKRNFFSPAAEWGMISGER
ncbi:MAG: linear amide C-N hydrolase [Candidatus Aminicenantes bacterium]|nr:linear amide C-N hydrolase [Candidatus Aminicenantes bacterium]